MDSKKPGSFSPVIFDYLKKFQDDPTSRVFAPLAEAYRKSGLVDQAIEIAREGLRVHPHFVGGRVALARALFDKKMYPEVLDELLSVVRDVPDNLVAQKLYAESALMVGRVTDALGAYKMLLYFTPGDPEIAQMVRELEVQAYEHGALVLRTDPKPPKGLKVQPSANPDVDEYDIRPAGQALGSDDRATRKRTVRQIEWLQALLSQIQETKTG
jgi:tetratricopeptide (TPR) repeat protein